MHHARNVDYHGLDHVAEAAPAKVVVTHHSDDIVVARDATGIEIRASGPISLRHSRPYFRLVDVKDSGTIFPAPHEHLGTPVEPLPDAVALVAIEYLTGMIKEATDLPQVP